jgi:c(7)-type cytochrome triheme protein
VTARVRRRRLAGALGLLVSSVALGASFPALVRIPRHNPAVPYPPRALFSHRTHESFGCYACHPSVFPQQTLVAFTHQEMTQGRYCGHCHDGRTAFAIPGAACARCHVDGR